MDTAHRTQSGCRDLAESPADVCSRQAGTYARHLDWRRCGGRLGSALRLIDTNPHRRDHTNKARSHSKALKLFKPIFAALATASALLSQLTLTPEEQRGRQIYERGVTASGRPLTASM